MKHLVKVIASAPGRYNSLDIALAISSAIDAARQRALGKPGSWDAPIMLGRNIIGRATVQPITEEE